MAFKKKSRSTKVYAAIILVVILAVATAAIVYTSTHRSSSVGVHVGDTFTYSITGSSSDVVPDSIYPDFNNLNNTAYSKVTITGVSGSVVSLTTDWVFTNGTDIQNQQTIDLSNGLATDQQGFWAIYPANLNVNNQLYPKENSALIVNSTGTQTFAASTRDRNFWSIQNEFYNINDPTGSTGRIEYDQVYFDRQTGMATSIINIQQYNNPQLELEINWELTSSNVWTV